MDCSRIKLDGHRCEREAIVEGLCLFHDALDKTKARKKLRNEAWAQILECLWTFQDQPKAYSILNETLAHLPYKEAASLWWSYKTELFHYHNHHPTTPRPLYVLSADLHNTQSRQVESQTQRTLRVLRSLPCPESGDTPSEVMTAWMEHDKIPGTHMVRCGQDLHTWYTHDPLYTEILDRTWAVIQASPFRDELVLRLYQETKDSLKTCASGHRARLCSILLGFDDRFSG